MKKRIKKMFTIFLIVLTLFFGVVPKQDKNKVEAFAISLPTIAWVLGSVAVAGVGGHVLSKGETTRLGMDVVNKMSQAGKDVRDYIYGSAGLAAVDLIMDSTLKSNIADTIQAEKEIVSAGSYTQSVMKLSANGSRVIDFNAPAGTTFSISLNAFSTSSRNGANFWVEYWGTKSTSWKSLVIELSDPSLTLDDSRRTTIQSEGDIEKIRFRTKTIGSSNTLTLSNIEIVDLGYVPEQEVSQERKEQMKDVPATLGDIQDLLGAIANGTYTIDVTQDFTGARSFDDILEGEEEIPGEVPSGFGVLGDILNAVKAIPATITRGLLGGYTSVKDMLDSLWNSTKTKIDDMADYLSGLSAGMLIFLGSGADSFKQGLINLGDTLTDVYIGALDGISSGIDSVTDTLTGISEGVRNLSGTIIDGITSGIGNVMSGVTGALGNIWETIKALAQSLGISFADVIAQIKALGISIGLSFADVLAKIIALPVTLWELVVPSVENLELIQTQAIALTETLKAEMPELYHGDNFKALFSNPRSIYDLEITYRKKTHKLIPIHLKPYIDSSKSVNTGLIVLFMITSVYKRYKGRGQLLK